MNDMDFQYPYTPLEKPMRITEQDWPEGTVPLVTIRCITYNHVNFIRDAIEGFLIQETTLPVEILIHDDASTDGTTDIVREYEAKYPQLIKAICQTENQYSQGIKPGQFLRPLIRGKYIALCEGDDYWTDPKKLQIQASYLEAHPECVISGHDSVVTDAFSNLIKKSVVRLSNRDFSADELKRGKATLPTATRMIRNIAEHNSFRYLPCFQGGDRFTIVTLGQYGGSHFHEEILPSVYRVHQGGIWSGMDRKSQIETGANTSFFVYQFFKEKEDKEIAKYWRKKWLEHILVVSPLRLMFKELLNRLLMVSFWKIWMRKVLGRRNLERMHSLKERIFKVHQSR